MVYEYMVKVYAYLVMKGKRAIEALPEPYQMPVAEYLANQTEGV